MRGPWILWTVGALAPLTFLHAAAPTDVEFRPTGADLREDERAFLIAPPPLEPGLTAGRVSGRRLHGGVCRRFDEASLVRSKGLHQPAHPETTVHAMEDAETSDARRAGGAQAVMRAIDILEVVAEGPISLPDLVTRVDVSKSTCHRIATALVERGLLKTSGRTGYRLGPLLGELVAKSGG